MKSSFAFCLSFLAMVVASCGTDDDGRIGTVIITANGEDFVRDGFVSEDGWSIEFESVFLNVEGPTAYQVVEQTEQSLLRHGGHPHENIPEGSAHVALTGEYFLALKQPAFEVGRVEDAPIGNYNRMAFNVKQAAADSQGLVADHEGYSIAMQGTATRDTDSIDFRIRLDEEMVYSDCGPNEDMGVLAENAEAFAEMTFHFDHIFGDFEEGDPDPTDETKINFVAVGFDPFAELAQDSQLDIDQEALGLRMSGADYLQFVDAVRTLGHSGEGHCHLE